MAAANSWTSAKFRRAWMPPAVAQAPIVTRRRERRRTRRIRSASAGVVIEPSTSERSYGPRIIRRDACEVGDVELVGNREQFVFAVEQAQLAAVAGSEFPH